MPKQHLQQTFGPIRVLHGAFFLIPQRQIRLQLLQIRRQIRLQLSWTFFLKKNI
jgi:hypothetical protein